MTPESRTIDVVLAEDNPYDAELVRRTIERCDFVSGVHWVRDGIELLDYLRCTGQYDTRDSREIPRLVLLDLKMPRVDGLDALRELKADERMRSIPIVMMTSSGERRDVAEAYRLGVNSFVVKPVDANELHDAMMTLCTYWLRLNRIPGEAARPKG